jgi:hypothetical protein
MRTQSGAPNASPDTSATYSEGRKEREREKREKKVGNREVGKRR